MSVEQQYYPKLQEQLDEIHVAADDTGAQRHIPKPVLGVGISAAFQQQPRHLHRGRTPVESQAVVKGGVA